MANEDKLAEELWSGLTFWHEGRKYKTKFKRYIEGKYGRMGVELEGILQEESDVSEECCICHLLFPEGMQKRCGKWYCEKHYRLTE